MHFVDAKALLSARNGFNLYRGCMHGCIYCDSRSACYRIEHAFEDVAVKRNAPELLDAALALCEQAHLWPDPLRSIGIRALELVPACAPHQLDLFEDAEHRARQRQLDITLDNLRARYGKTCVLRGRACFDPALGLVQREEHAFLRK